MKLSWVTEIKGNGKKLGCHAIIIAKTTFLLPAFPGKPVVYWEYKLPSDNTAVLVMVLKKDQPHVVLLGIHILDCNYGPERNKWNKQKAAKHWEKSRMLTRMLTRMWTQSRLSSMDLYKGNIPTQGLQTCNLYLN